MAACHKAFFWTHLTALASATVTALWSLATTSRLVLRGTAKTYSFGCPHLKDFIGVRRGNGGGHPVVPSHPIPLPRCHSQLLPDIFTQCDGALSCLNHSLARGILCWPDRTVMRGYDIIQQLAPQAADGGLWQYPWQGQPKQWWSSVNTHVCR